ncbi:OLC1v1001616C1 [Oldenlandia corymbosa var. corymbosa]|uniref:OLC1v1001616C1 n=1 Tax=Oldenlandia corymbosa var. corymbosa TaxID=529605 RepID=A0AAV1D7Z0_OLDCO|nr:OLC1v1001616C1 [Oldenlandia corymbosa var. corymbosa]
MEIERNGKRRRRSESHDDDSKMAEWFLFELSCKLPVKDLYRTLLPDDKEDFIQPGPEFDLLTLPTSPVKGSCLRVIASDKGFVLVGRHLLTPTITKTQYEFFICNVMTHHWFSLPAPPVFCDAHNLFHNELGVGFIAQVDDEFGFLISYKVVNSRGKFLCGCFMAQILSSETSQWEDYFRVLPSQNHHHHPLVFFRCQHRAVLLNTTLYWNDPNVGFLAFDPYADENDSNKFRIVEFPEDSVRNGYIAGRASKCGVCQGRLMYFEIILGPKQVWNRLQIWELEENIRWRIRRKVEVHPPAWTDAQFVSGHPYDPDVIYLYMRGTQRWFSYNVNTKTKAVQSLPSSVKDNCGWFLIELPPRPFFIPPSFMSVKSLRCESTTE